MSLAFIMPAFVSLNTFADDSGEPTYSLTFDFNGGATYDGQTSITRSNLGSVGMDLNEPTLVSCFDYTMTGIGEEALFRGTGYEEMKVSFGIVPAKIIDAVIFPAVHIPQQVIAGYDWPSILLTAAVQTGVTFLLQWIYDQGGLKDSIAVHAWVDIISSTLTYLFTTGTQGNTFALNINFSTKL